MYQIKNTLVSDDIGTEKFLCDLEKCKGICCVEGDSGAPLDQGEAKLLEKEFDKIKPFLRNEGIESIQKKGKYIIDLDGDLVTPLVNDKECAYLTFDDNGMGKCGIELAYEKGKTNFKKPISCHLYPVRLQKHSSFTAVNYHVWNICSDACVLGKKENVKIYEFLKEPLIRKFGEEWYDQLCNAIESN